MATLNNKDLPRGFVILANRIWQRDFPLDQVDTLTPEQIASEAFDVALEWAKAKTDPDSPVLGFAKKAFRRLENQMGALNPGIERWTNRKVVLSLVEAAAFTKQTELTVALWNRAGPGRSALPYHHLVSPLCVILAVGHRELLEALIPHVAAHEWVAEPANKADQRTHYDCARDVLEARYVDLAAQVKTSLLQHALPVAARKPAGPRL